MDAMNSEPTQTEVAATIGDFVRRRRVALGMSQADLGRRLGKYQAWASQLECNRATVRDEDVPGLADALQVGLATLQPLLDLQEQPGKSELGVSPPSVGIVTKEVVMAEVLRWQVGGRSLPIEELSREDLLGAVRSLFEANGRLRLDFEKEMGEIAEAYEQKIRSLHHVLAAYVELEIREAVRDKMEMILEAVMAEVERRSSIAVSAQQEVMNDKKEETNNGD
jgi:transcriptional regulator with XRE-family HTH domain